MAFAVLLDSVLKMPLVEFRSNAYVHAASDKLDNFFATTDTSI
jgi:hypothetical protein